MFKMGKLEFNPRRPVNIREEFQRVLAEIIPHFDEAVTMPTDWDYSADPPESPQRRGIITARHRFTDENANHHEIKTEWATHWNHETEYGHIILASFIDGKDYDPDYADQYALTPYIKTMATTSATSNHLARMFKIKGDIGRWKLVVTAKDNNRGRTLVYSGEVDAWDEHVVDKELQRLGFSFDTVKLEYRCMNTDAVQKAANDIPAYMAEVLDVIGKHLRHDTEDGVKAWYITAESFADLPASVIERYYLNNGMVHKSMLGVWENIG